MEHSRCGGSCSRRRRPTAAGTITLPELAIDALRTHKASQAHDYVRLGLGRDERDLVIAEVTTVPGKGAGELVRMPMDPAQLSKVFLRLVRRLGFPCRTTCGTPTRPTRLKAACIPRSPASASAMPRSRSRWTPTATSCRACRKTLPAASTRRRAGTRRLIALHGIERWGTRRLSGAVV